MELVSWLVGDEYTDHPACTCPVIGAFMRSWNDSLPDEDRTAILLPLLPKVIDTRGSAALAERRSLMAADWLVRTHTVAWLRLAGLTTQAEALASLPEITSMAQVPSIRGPIKAVRKDADAARAAARDAAWDAAWAAAWAAARAAAGGAAWDAAWAAAWAAAGGAAWDAAWGSAGAAAGAAARAAAGGAAWDAAWGSAGAAAGAAARAAAGGAAWDAAWGSAGAAAGAAAMAAAGGAAWDAGWGSAGAAAGAAAGGAAWDAGWGSAGAKLEPTRQELQASAITLVERMCALTDADIAEAA